MFIKFFKQLSKKSSFEAGGKGASLGEMTNAKIPVPPGFVVLASAFDRFLEETELDAEIEAALKKVNHKDINSVEEASEDIRGLIKKVRIPKDIADEITKNFKALKSPFVAVRSSATAEDSSAAAWAGQLETYLNTTEKDVLKNVQMCWSSLFTPRAIFYRIEKKMQKEKVSVAVVIQTMVQSEVSGICFTVHPVTKDRNQMVIEAGFGLGEAVVSGSVTPDTYVVHKDDFSILDINVSEQNMAIYKVGQKNMQKKLSAKVGGKQKLIGKQIVELAKICKNIEKHYKVPEDIEWALAGGKFYITQSRPITTL
ncbi:MAG TPA: PEP/pyruvate-binding domain-containing protein [Methylomirabilota bacterium]|nr:PEP/pyruvate-binding domain-containing protein [Methylomirabilota bacterium]